MLSQILMGKVQKITKAIYQEVIFFILAAGIITLHLFALVLSLMQNYVLCYFQVYSINFRPSYKNLSSTIFNKFELPPKGQSKD